MSKWVVVKEGVVASVIEWSGVGDPPTPETLIEVDADAYVGPGFAWDGESFVPPEPEVRQPTPGELVDEAISGGDLTMEEVASLLPEELREQL